MAGRRTSRRPEPGEAVPTWPRVTARLDASGGGMLSWSSTPAEISADDRDAALAAVVARCTRLAQTIARAIRLELHEGNRMQEFAVHPSAIMQAISADGLPETDAGSEPELTIITGTCVACAAAASAAETRCRRCGTPEPLLRGGISLQRRADPEPDQPAVTEPRSGRRALRRASSQASRAGTAAGPNAGPTTESISRPGPERRPRRWSRRTTARLPAAPRTLVIEFEDSSRAVLAGSAAVGRNPSPVNGRIPVRVDSRDNTVSRTHALVDLDRSGRILVTDYHSTHGVHLSGASNSTFSPGVVYRVPSGARLRLGDVVCRVSTEPALTA
ncbi:MULTISPECIES: FHA domain-containing protein [unclassified Pseudoclavibacter]|uniref:FHA domain-containing protein n=1 Tax=unclassified Pseudoclavibacter TaxID=2615177 RepID=UPI001BAA7B7D|nr:FHA domain-containing protein [Pseudoclavibacter sp. Marseille-Q4354]MBS3178978.1 FHA domain-containing protein [Pseudoclavibacter sp. Marseille-Q4354]